MKNYIGTKKVMAEPMNEITAVEMGYARPNEDNHEWREGYHVVYPDGYHSWSPKDVFEQAYKCAETHIDRMRIEYKELNERMIKLGNFIHSEKYGNLDDEEQSLLRGQFGAMLSYCHILKNRISKVENKQGGWVSHPSQQTNCKAMRVIKFRGKDIETGEWLYGDLRQRAGCFRSIIQRTCCEGKIAYNEIAVKRETVGQFTGSYDKNGRAIYEGDIVKAKYTKRGEVKYLDVHFCVDFNGYQALIGREEYEVVGNIHDKKGGNDENY